jgi:hypothetical protein
MDPILTVLGLERMQEMTVTEMLYAAQRGNGEAWDKALRVLYGELRFFAGMTLEEIVAATNSSVRTVKRDGVAARALLYNYLSGVKQ